MNAATQHMTTAAQLDHRLSPRGNGYNRINRRLWHRPGHRSQHRNISLNRKHLFTQRKFLPHRKRNSNSRNFHKRNIPKHSQTIRPLTNHQLIAHRKIRSRRNIVRRAVRRTPRPRTLASRPARGHER